jgi:hypothetical protein
LGRAGWQAREISASNQVTGQNEQTLETRRYTGRFLRTIRNVLAPIGGGKSTPATLSGARRSRGRIFSRQLPENRLQKQVAG